MTFKKGEGPKTSKAKGAVKTSLEAPPSPVTPVVEAAPQPHNTGHDAAPSHPAQETEASIQPSPAEPFKNRTIIFPVDFAAMHKNGFLMTFSRGQRVTVTEDLKEFLDGHGFHHL